MKSIGLLYIFLFLLCTGTEAIASKDIPFTQEDRDRIIRLEVKLDETNKRLLELREDTNRQFKELREDTNRQFKEMREDTNRQFKELREDTNRQLTNIREDTNNSFQRLMTFLNIITAIFTTLTVAIIGFAYWDRRTIIRKATDTAVREIEDKWRLNELIKALKALAPQHSDLAALLKTFHIL